MTIEALIRACFEEKDALPRVNKLWIQLACPCLAEAACTVRLSVVGWSCQQITPVDALVLRVCGLTDLARLEAYEQGGRRGAEQKDLELMCFLQGLGSRVSMFGLQSFLYANDLCDLVKLVNQGLLVKDIDLPSIPVTWYPGFVSTWCSYLLHFVLNRCMCNSRVHSGRAGKENLLQHLQRLLEAGVTILPFSEIDDPTVPPPFAKFNRLQQQFVAAIWPGFEQYAQHEPAGRPRIWFANERISFISDLCRICKQAKQHASWERRRPWVLCCVRKIHLDCQRAPLVQKIFDNPQGTRRRMRMVRRRLRGKQAPEWRIVVCFLSRSFYEFPGIAHLLFSFI